MTKPNRPHFDQTVKEMADWIDSASYEELLKKWRFSEIGDPYFTNTDVGKYFEYVMFDKKSSLSQDEQSSISKRVGWGMDISESDSVKIAFNAFRKNDHGKY